MRDTVRAIVEDNEYRRALHRSLFSRLWRWVSELFDRMFAAAVDFPYGRHIALAAVALIVLLVIARIVYASRLGTDELESARERAGKPRVNPLAEAEGLAAEGAYLEAAHALYRAVLETLSRRDGIRLHASRTSGEYARELRRRGSWSAAPFREFARHYDRLVFGHAVADAAAWSALRDDAERVFRVERAA